MIMYLFCDVRETISSLRSSGKPKDTPFMKTVRSVPTRGIPALMRRSAVALLCSRFETVSMFLCFTGNDSDMAKTHHVVLL